MWKLLAASMFATSAWAQGAPCSAPEHRQFDFWLGRWQVFTPDGRKAGENLIEVAHGGCVLIERWQGAGGFSGTSLNSWDARAKLWRQHWVDNQGGLLQLAGRLDGTRMLLSGEAPPLRHRIAWTPLPDGAVRQHWEQSTDGGATWTTAFDGRYVKVGS